MLKHLRKLLLLLPIVAILLCQASPAFASPYESYNYDWWGDPKAAPAAYLPEKQIQGKDLGIGDFNAPEDIFIANKNEIYIADTGNNRIIRMDKDFTNVKVYDSFNNNGIRETFSTPQGVFVDKSGNIYVADSGNKRVVELTSNGTLVRVIGEPKSDILPANFVYEPIKLVVDSANRMYVVGKGVFDGIMQFDAGGKFTGFTGVNKVTYSPAELFWKTVMTKEQRSKMVLFIPQQFNNVEIDEEGFIYATVSEQFSDAPVKRLNPTGEDVLKRIGYFPPKGDIRFDFGGLRKGPSMITSVALDQNGIYSILDNTRGRIFTYDRDGKIMYVYGLLGEQVGNFRIPSDMDMLGDRMVVSDKGLNQLVVFKPTRYGSIIRQAVIDTDIGNEETAVAAWQEALQLNNNLEIAYLGIGKAKLRNGNNQEALTDFKLGMNTVYYSRAFERYRKEFMWENFSKIAIGFFAAIALLIVAKRFIKVKETEPGVARFAWYTIFHPFNGYWDMKFEKKGRIWFALLLLAILAALYLMKQQYTGFIFNPKMTRIQANTFDQVKNVILPFFLWCVANWSITTLMDGEGKFKEIFMVTAYALIPIILFQIPLIVFSNIITIQEASFYHLLDFIATIWFVGLLFVGMLTVHQYSIPKTIATMLLTLVVIGIILFIGLLFFSLLQEILTFFSTIYKELSFRFGEG
jgi:hypothetical protein